MKQDFALPVSPASPLYAMRLYLLSVRVLSSLSFRMVAPRIAAFDEAMIVKSLPVIPSKTSLLSLLVHGTWSKRSCTYMVAVLFDGVDVCFSGSRSEAQLSHPRRQLYLTRSCTSRVVVRVRAGVHGSKKKLELQFDIKSEAES